ncbi:MAG: hypothetical protein ACKVKR_01515 [Pseudomonadales bacterium]|tara:strand:+ start:837 stop:1025 length:189 start_codon:yes stop_codon:yes gene_type:complete
MDKSSIKLSAKEKELKRFHSEMKFLDQRYQSEKDNLEKRKMRDTERAQKKHAALLRQLKISE